MSEIIIPNDEWTDNDWLSLSSRLNYLLKQGKVKVTFTKKDGTTRVMTCSLKPELLPKVEITESDENKPERKKSETSIAVYDLDIKSWRSFVVKSITNVTVED